MLEELFCGTKPPNCPSSLLIGRSALPPAGNSRKARLPELPAILNAVSALRDLYATLEEQITNTLDACLTELAERGLPPGKGDEEAGGTLTAASNNAADFSITRPMFVRVPERQLAATKQIFRVSNCCFWSGENDLRSASHKYVHVGG